MESHFILFITVLPDSIILQPPGQTEEGMKVDAIWELKPGEERFGYSYEELRALGSGKHRLADREPPEDDEDSD